MARYKNTEPDVPVTVIRKEVFKTDDEYIYENVYLSDGGVVQSLHPLHPAEPKEVLFQEVGEMMYDAWVRAMSKKEAEASATLASAPAHI